MEPKQSVSAACGSPRTDAHPTDPSTRVPGGGEDRSHRTATTHGVLCHTDAVTKRPRADGACLPADAVACPGAGGWGLGPGTTQAGKWAAPSWKRL